MLISQRIAQDPHFLKVEGNKKVVLPRLAALRAQVIGATKFVASDFGLLAGERATIRDVRENIFGGLSESLRVKKERIYADYARLPFDKVAIEYGEVMMLLVRRPGGFTMTIIDQAGGVRYLVLHVSYSSGRQTVSCDALTSELDYLMRTNEELQTKAKALLKSMEACAWVVCETLVFLNCRNVEQVAYEPTKRELGSIPKVLQPKFTYHVLNVFRERKAYDSIEAIERDMHAPSLTRQSRCHVVRGHFKRTKGGLFWWNEFVRNRKNADTLGVVSKDYCVRVVSP